MQSSERVQCCVRCWYRSFALRLAHESHTQAILVLMTWLDVFIVDIQGGMQQCEFRVKRACAFSVWRIWFFCAGNWHISTKRIEFGLVHMQGLDVSRKLILIWTLCSKSRFLGIKTNLEVFGCMFSVAGNTRATKRRNDTCSHGQAPETLPTNSTSWHSDPRDIIMVKCVTYWIFLIWWSLLLSWWYFLTLCARNWTQNKPRSFVKGTLVQLGKGKFLRRAVLQAIVIHHQWFTNN